MIKLVKINFKKLKKTLKKRQIRILLILLAVTLVLLSILIYSLSTDDKDEILEIMFSQEKYIPVKKGSKYGFIDTNGELVIDPAYDEANSFYGDYALVSNVENEQKEYFLIDKKGEIKKKAEGVKAPKYYVEYGVWLIDNALYSYDLKTLFDEAAALDYIGEGYFSYQKNDEKKSGIIDFKGEKIFSWDEDYITVNISENSFKNARYASLSNFEEAECIIDLENGKKVFELDDPKNKYIQKEKNNIFRIIDRANKYKTEKWLYLKDGKIKGELLDVNIYDLVLISEKKDIVKIDYGQDYETKNKEDRYAYYDMKEEEFISDYEEEVDIDGILKNRYGYTIYKYENYGLKNKRNREILKDEYESIEFLNLFLFKYTKYHTKKEIAILKKGDSLLLFDAKKKKILEEFEYVSLKEIAGSTFLSMVQYEDDGHTKKSVLIYNVLTNNFKEFDKDAEIEIGANYVKVDTKRVVKYYDNNLEEIYEE